MGEIQKEPRGLRRDFEKQKTRSGTSAGSQEVRYTLAGALPEVKSQNACRRKFRPRLNVKKCISGSSAGGKTLRNVSAEVPLRAKR